MGEGGYQVGNFPVGWAEWNGKYRDAVRALLERRRRADRRVGLSAYRVERSLRTQRPPALCERQFCHRHDGFTVQDLVSYNQKHNEANGEENRDGTDDNRSWNCGAEGPTGDPEIRALRMRQKRNFLATLLLSQGSR